MLLLSVLIFSAAVIATAAYAVIYKKAGLFDPITQFLFFYALYILPLALAPLFIDADQVKVSPLPDFIDYMPAAVLLCALGLPFFLWAYYSPMTGRIARRFPVPGYPKVSKCFKPFFRFDRTRAAGVLICGLSFALLWQLSRVARVDGVLGFLLLGYNSTAEMTGRGYLAICFPWLFVGSMLFLYRYAFMRAKYGHYKAECAAANRKPRKAPRIRIDLLVFVSLFMFQVLASVLLGSRNSILSSALALVIFWHLAIKKISLLRLATFALGGFIALGLIGLTRVSNYESLDDFIRHSSGKSVDISGVTYALMTTADPFETMPQIMRKFGSDDVPCQWGMSYLRAPLFVIPQAIFPKRPMALANWYIAAFYGGGWGENIGHQFFFLSEGYLNFGPIGVVLTMLVWGFLLGILNQYRIANPANKGVVLLFALCLSFLFKCIAGESIGLLVGLPTNFLLIAILGLTIAGGFNRGELQVHHLTSSK